MDFPLFGAVTAQFSVLPRNCLAGMHVPPGDTLILFTFLGFWYELLGGETEPPGDA